MYMKIKDFPGNSVVKNPPANALDVDSVSGLGRSPGGGNWQPRDRGAWRAVVHGVAEELDMTWWLNNNNV